MSLYPRLEVAPFPFPKIDEYVDYREKTCCELSALMTDRFRDSPNFHVRESLETPDVERYNENIQLKSGKGKIY